MEVNGVNSSSSSTTTQKKKDILDKDVFLKILTVQLSNQDPLNPQDNTQYISQLAQFTSLEQSKNLNESMDKLLLSQKITEGNQMVGQSVEFNIDDTNVTELVKGVKVDDGSVYLVTDKGERSIDNVVGTSSSGNTMNTSMDKLLLSQRFNEGTLLIGADVEFKVNDQSITEMVTGVKIVNGSVYLVTSSGQRNIEDVVGVGV